MKLSEQLQNEITKLEKQKAAIERRIEAITKEKLAAEVRESIPKAPIFPKRVDRYSSKERYEIFNKIVAHVKKQHEFSIYRDAYPGGTSVKLADSYFQKNFPTKVREQLRLLADKVSYSTYVGYYSDEKPVKVERYFFRVIGRERTKKLAAQKGRAA